MTAWRKLAGIPIPNNDGFGFADDSVAMISTAMYREHVLPYHRRLCDAFSSPTQLRGIHLCGDATRHFHKERMCRETLAVYRELAGSPRPALSPTP